MFHFFWFPRFWFSRDFTGFLIFFFSRVSIYSGYGMLVVIVSVLGYLGRILEGDTAGPLFVVDPYLLFLTFEIGKGRYR